ncbi:MAG: preprotein translocase subunit SecY [Ruminococcaceae bacterium]|nr:preprotein translocase subunit SecY [Oscillospiraceae bacterium]
MFTTLRNAWKIPELRKKLLFVLLILLIYRIGNAVPVPYVNVELLNEYFNANLSDTVLGLLNAMSGSALSRATVLALSIQPYINASIIIQLLTVAIPALERLSKEGGEEGREKINRITRYTTVGLGVILGMSYYFMLRNSDPSMLTTTKIWPYMFVIILAFTAGSAFVMWLGEQITEFGIGNGISMILFANIISRIPSGVSTIFTNVVADPAHTWYKYLLMLLGMLALIILIVFIDNSERRLPVQYAKRVVGRKVYGGQNTYLPIKVNMSGVLPIIFAQSIASMPATIHAFVNGDKTSWAYRNIWSNTSTVYAICYFLLIIFFSYFYSSIQYNPVEIANNMKKNGGFIPGFRPGRPTSEFIGKVINKITIFGALYLAVVALLPIITGNIFKINSLSIGGTSVIIVVGVAIETMAAIEAQMMMRHYKGFLE